jgi:methyl coenzyme M reductase subunit C-like uncharacterized protein (methanogenesis marker protein 7)
MLLFNRVNNGIKEVAILLSWSSLTSGLSSICTKQTYEANWGEITDVLADGLAILGDICALLETSHLHVVFMLLFNRVNNGIKEVAILLSWSSLTSGLSSI